MDAGDELLGMIRTELRRRRVPAAQLDDLTEVVGRTVIAVMSTPHFYEKLRVVLELRQENELLRYHLAQSSAMLNRLVKSRLPTPARPKPKKKAAPRKIPVKKAPAVRVRGSTAANREAFRKGFKGT